MRLFDGLERRVIRTTEELRAFAPEWSTLWRSDPAATPFQSVEWLLPWWDEFGQPGLRAVTIYERGELRAFLPMYVYLEPASGERRLLPLGVSSSDYLDGIYSPACRENHVRAAIDCLIEEAGWDSLNVSQLRPESLLLRALRDEPALGGGVRFETSLAEGQSCSRLRAVPISDLPRSIRRNAMYYRNRASRAGQLQLEIAGPADLEGAFQSLRRLHSQSWEDRGEPGVLSDPRVLRWHGAALPGLERSGLLRLVSLKLDGETIGVVYSLVDPEWRDGRVEYVYLPGYSPVHAALRPGTVLLALEIERAAREGIVTIDLLRGDEAYKKLWGALPVATRAISMRAGVLAGTSG